MDPVVKVVVNDEEQYSIWPAFRTNAPGWRDEGFQGSEKECLTHIAAIWPDIRPASLRE
ncbi:MbtH family protein [Solihabitans fulvus]|uniref:MbtH family protein n=1 Tax=Solihabitans fulvus TaxID=1892852 RepID=A0A5B2WLF0_9PSEU|nr:MbtH family NRPS accessory protein [Solihabitans fulvus]KAA2252833.1 MbtH family protein [Solihabitans fulvus]